LKEAENGEIDLIPGEEVFQKAHKIITQWPTATSGPQPGPRGLPV
jgi:hypothetical protein